MTVELIIRNLLWKTTLKKRNASWELRQSIDPAGDLLTAENLRESGRKVIAVVVHQMVFVASKLVSDLLRYPSDVLFWEFSVADLNALSRTMGWR